MTTPKSLPADLIDSLLADYKKPEDLGVESHGVLGRTNVKTFWFICPYFTDVSVYANCRGFGVEGCPIYNRLRLIPDLRVGQNGGNSITRHQLVKGTALIK